jgi:site-specific DNA recombinase
LTEITAAIYARKSKFTEKGDSITNQINLCKKHLENLGINKVKIYKDEGFSGKNTDRPEFLKMLEDARQKKFNLLVCYKLDRISRSVADFSNLINELEKLNVSFISVNEQFDTSTAMGRAMMYICSVFGQLERETISIRIRDNMYALAQNGNWLGGEEPTGFKNKRVNYTDQNGKEKTFCILEPDDKEINLVKLIFSKYLEYKSLSKVEKYLLSNNIKTKNGNDWSKNTIRTILSNPVYVKVDENVLAFLTSQGATVFGEADGTHGMLIYSKRNGKVGKYKDPKDWIYAIAEHEGVISSEDWLKVQQLININKSKAPALGSSGIALLSGLIRCAKCNSYMRVAYGKQYSDKGIKKFYYVCSLKNNSGKTRCDNRNVNGVELDAIIIDKLKEMSVDKGTLISELQKYKTELENSTENIEFKNINQGIKQNKAMLENLLNNISMTTDKEMVTLLFQKINDLKEENKLLEKRLEELRKETETQSNTINSCDAFMKLIKNFTMVADIATIEEKRKLVSSIIERVYVDGDTGKVSIRFWGVDDL